MRTILFHGIIFIICILPQSSVLAQFKVVHDVPNTTTIPAHEPLVLGDGSIVTYHLDSGEYIFRKYDQSGVQLWNKSFVAQGPSWWNNGIFSMARDGADGFIFARYAGHTSTPLDSMWFENHDEQFFDIMRVDGAGNVSSSFELKKSYLTYSASSWTQVDHLDVAISPDGGIVLLVSYDESSMGSIEICKISSAGVLEWSRCLGNGQWLWPDTYNPTYTYEMHPTGKVELLTDGSIIYTEGGQYGVSHLRLAKLDGNGDILWMKRYIYGNTVSGIEFSDIIVDGSDNVHAAGFLTTTVGRFHIFFRTSDDGDLQRTDIYRTPYILANGEFGIDEDGMRYHRVQTTEPVVFPEISQGILIADTLGSPARFVRRDDQIIMPNNVFIPINSIDVHQDRVAVSGLLHHEHVDFAFTTRYETLFSFDTDDVFSCFMNDTSYAHIAVPLEIITTEDVTDAVSIDVLQYYSIVPDPLAFNTITNEPLDTLCVFAYNLLQIPTGIGEANTERDIPFLQRSLLPSGIPLQLNDIGASTVEVWSTNGSLKQQIQIDGPNTSLATMGWAKGMYLVRALDKAGSLLRTERFMLE